MRRSIALISRFVNIVVVLVALFVPLATASAHAVVVRSDPADNAVLVTSPQQVSLWFSEPISPQFATAHLLNTKGETIQAAGIQTDPAQPDQLVVDLPDLPTGVYNLVWKTLSDADGHFAQGHIVFGVGAGVDLSSAAQGAATADVSWVEVILRWLNYSALITLVGAIAVVFLVFERSFKQAGEQGPAADALAKARIRVWIWAAYVALGALCIGIAVLIWQIATSPLAAEALDSARPSIAARVVQLLTQTRWGMWWMVRETLLLLILFLIYAMASAVLTPAASPQEKATNSPGKKAVARKGRKHPPTSPEPAAPTVSLPRSGFSTPTVLVLTVLLLALILCQALSGHAAALQPNPALAIGASALHLLAASIWVGGIVALCVGLLPLMHSGDADAARLASIGWRPFSIVAVVSVCLVVATGLYSAGREVVSVDAALGTLYGRALLGKAGLVLAVGCLGIVNSSLLHPGLAVPIATLLRRPRGWTPVQPKHFAAVVATEAAAGLLVVLATGLLTASPPARGPQFIQGSPTQAQTAAPTHQVGDLQVSMAVQPNQPGPNVLTIRVDGLGSTDVGEIIRVITHFTYMGQDIGTVDADASPLEAGVYQVSGTQFSIGGPWKVEVVVRRKGLEDNRATFNWVVGRGMQPVVPSRGSLEPWLTPAAALLLAVAAGIGALVWWRRQSTRPAAVAQSTHNE